MSAPNPCQTCSRRKFIGSLAAACGAISTWVPGSALAQETPPLDLNQVLPLRIADFPALQQEGGSLMLTPDGGTTVLMINRGAGNQIYVMDPTCRHAACRVDRYDPISRQTSCPCHGSTYAIDGEVTNGPARDNLIGYPSRFENGILEVELPEFSFGFTSMVFARTAGGRTRLALTFATRNLSLYRIRGAAAPAGPFAPASFATTLEGALDRTQLEGNGDPKTVYVDAEGPRGFFALELVLFEVG